MMLVELQGWHVMSLHCINKSYYLIGNVTYGLVTIMTLLLIHIYST